MQKRIVSTGQMTMNQHSFALSAATLAASFAAHFRAWSKFRAKLYQTMLQIAPPASHIKMLLTSLRRTVVRDTPMREASAATADRELKTRAVTAQRSSQYSSHGASAQ